ncbi:hypothetical protein HO173_010109 [Letharia columbiana]|uniref:DUF2293 domain-containing protein n=1 Tax=Letharia columbiana TaxID=112416 RepID=A0A8H6FNI1_9LECA|nr:uncharacterized protein HO173_010109 [Letharia columbiana]KAF6231807.1 hypothetical protein HO173_010109 [Letharia columbiana]
MNSVGTSQPRALLKHAYERLSDISDHPPSGYVFVPKGDVYITRHCRNLTSVSGRWLWIVYDRKTNERLGIHCFQQIVEAVKEDAAGTEEKRQRAVAAKDSRDHEKAHKVLLEFFPNIPEGACTEILGHGFQKGSGRVGRSQILEDQLKVHLAVNAHIRHRLTQYDSILAANRGQDAKLAAREMVYGEVRAIADSWRATSSQTWNSNSRTSVPRGSAATLEANRQRRTQQSIAQTTPANEAQVLEEALSGLHLNENQREVGARTEAAQRRAQKVAQKLARKGRFRETTRDLLRQYELDPSIEMTKNKKKGVLRLQMEQKERRGKGKYPQKLHERQNPNPTNPKKREGYRRLKITANGVELEPRELDRYVPDDGPSVEQPHKPRLLRSNYRKPGDTPTSSGDLGDTPGDGVQLEARRHDRYVPNYGRSPSIDPPRKSRYPLRSSHQMTGDLDANNNKRLGLIEETTSEGRLLVEDSEWMDIDNISLRTAGVHLA